MKFNIAIICISDRSSRGEREDKSKTAIEKFLENMAQTTFYKCVPDEKSIIEETLIDVCDNKKAHDYIIYNRGTGLAPRDVTPEATLSVAQKLVSGIAQEIRSKSMEYTQRAMLSRAVCVIRNNVLIVNLPGSPRACVECLQVIEPVLGHVVELLCENVSDCARE